MSEDQREAVTAGDLSSRSDAVSDIWQLVQGADSSHNKQADTESGGRRSLLRGGSVSSAHVCFTSKTRTALQYKSPSLCVWNNLLKRFMIACLTWMRTRALKRLFFFLLCPHFNSRFKESEPGAVQFTVHSLWDISLGFWK